MLPSKAKFLLSSQVFLVNSTTVKGVLYGLAFALYISCARLLYVQLKDQDKRKQNLFTLIFTSLIMALQFFNFAISSRNMQISYVDHGDYPVLGGFGYLAFVSPKLPINTVGGVLDLVLMLMLFAIQIWRLWVVWKASRYSLFIMILPVLAFFVELGTQVPIFVLYRHRPSLRLANILLLMSYICQLVMTATVTIAIIIRIVMVCRRTVNIMGNVGLTNPYTSVISMLVESFAIELVWILAQLPLPFLESHVAVAVNLFFAGNQSYIKVWKLKPTDLTTRTDFEIIFIQMIAYFLIVYRVSVGRGWKEDTAERLTSLQWNRSDGLQTHQITTRVSEPLDHESM